MWERVDLREVSLCHLCLPLWLSGLGTNLLSQAPHLLLSGLDEQEGGLMSFTLEIEPGGREHMCYLPCMSSLTLPTVSLKV